MDQRRSVSLLSLKPIGQGEDRNKNADRFIAFDAMAKEHSLHPKNPLPSNSVDVCLHSRSIFKESVHCRLNEANV